MRWAVLVLAVLTPAAAEAQACCAGGSALTPGRLQRHEDVAVGVSARFNPQLGSFDSRRRYVPNPSGVHELGLEQDLFLTLRLFERAQVTMLVPFVETFRWVPRLHDSGGGLGDLNVSARYDFISAGEHLYAPGVAALVGLTLPTGRTPESATRPLATDATGAGALQFNLGGALEQNFDDWLVNVTALLSLRTARQLGALTSQLGPQLSVLAAVGYTFENEAALVLSARYDAETDATINRVRVSHSGRAATTLALTGTLPLSDDWRVQGGVSVVLPVSQLGQNQNSNVGLTMTIVRAWH